MIKEYIVLTGSGLKDDWLEDLDHFERDIVNDFIRYRQEQGQGVELIGGLALILIGDRVHFTQTLLVRE